MDHLHAIVLRMGRVQRAELTNAQVPAVLILSEWITVESE